MKSKLLKRIGALAVAMTLVFANGIFASAASDIATNGNASSEVATDGNAGQDQSKPGNQTNTNTGNQTNTEKDPTKWDVIQTDDYTIEPATKTDAGWTAKVCISENVKADRANDVLAKVLQEKVVTNESWVLFRADDSSYVINTANLNTLKSKNMSLTIGSMECTWTFDRIVNASSDFSVNSIKFSTNNDKVKALLDSVSASNYLQFNIAGTGALPGPTSIDAYPGDGLLKADAGRFGGKLYVYHYNTASGKLEMVPGYTHFTDYGGVYKDCVYIEGLTSKGDYVLSTVELPDSITTGTVISAPTHNVKTNDELTDAIKTGINQAEAGTTVSVDVPDGLKVSKSVFEAAKNKGVKLQIKSKSSTAVWNFADYSALSDSMKDFDPTITTGENIQAINDALGKLTVPAGMKSITVDFAFEGTLPGKTDVTLDLSAAGFANNATVYLYYYNPQTKQLEKSATGTYVDGYATFTITHCSQYLVTDKELAGAGKDDTPITPPASPKAPSTAPTKAPKTGDNNAVALYVVLCGLGVAVVAVAKRKRNA